MIPPRAAPIVVADTVTALDARHAGAVVVSGSHGGLIAARYAIRACVRAAVFNDAGIGCEEAGVAGLRVLAARGIAAAAVSHLSARIGDGNDTLMHGIVSRANEAAAPCGVVAGMHCTDAAHLLRNAAASTAASPPSLEDEPRTVVRVATRDAAAIVAIDSIGFVEPQDAGAILVIGSHGGLHGGVRSTALSVDAYAAFFHDAGRGKDDAGISRLPVLASRGIAAGTVDYRTARIGDARSMWATGVLSFANDVLAGRGARPGMTLRACVETLAGGQT